MASPFKNRLKELRLVMERGDTDFYIIPMNDKHNSEYIAPNDKRIEFISGFSGSSGQCLITKDEAFLWTDSRYYLQASKELPEYWTLMKQGRTGVPTIHEKIISLSKGRKSVGFASELIPYGGFKEMKSKLKNCSLVPYEKDAVDQIWKKNVNQDVKIFPISSSGSNPAKKVARLRKHLKSVESGESRISGMFVNALDSIAWMTDLRGVGEIEFNPVFFSFMWIPTNDKSSPIVFLAKHLIQNEISEHLKAHGIECRDSDILPDFLQEMKMSCTKNNSKVLMAKTQVMYSTLLRVDIENVHFVDINPIDQFKACKNQTELQGMKDCQTRDGAAIFKLIHYLKTTCHKFPKNSEDHKDKLVVSEYEMSEMVLKNREEFGGDMFKGPSFETIASSGPSAAIIHYSPPKKGSRTLYQNDLFLLDSGGHYLDGTTDTTRTILLGEDSKAMDAEAIAYTAVLKGHLALRRVIFPEGTKGPTLDVLARKSLWELGLDYGHGTGHGVGHFLNVHEGPCGISASARSYDSPIYKTSLTEGMVLSNEPGYYEDNKFGIRIENLVVVEKQKTTFDHYWKTFFGFTDLTYVPYERDLIRVDMLNSNERKQINVYHQKCLELLSPFFKDQKPLLSFLKDRCLPL